MSRINFFKSICLIILLINCNLKTETHESKDTHDTDNLGNFRGARRNRKSSKSTTLDIPYHQTYEPGINFHGICKRCKKSVIANLGFDATKYDDRMFVKSNPGFFDIGYILAEAPCPRCKKGKLDEDSITKIGVFMCHYDFYGRMGRGKETTKNKGFASSYKIFNLKDSNGTVPWNSFKITVKKEQGQP